MANVIPKLLVGFVLAFSSAAAEQSDIPATLNQEVIQLYAQGRYSEAVRSLAILERINAEHPDAATALDNLAKLYGAQGHYAEAEPCSSGQLRFGKTPLVPITPT